MFLIAAAAVCTAILLASADPGYVGYRVYLLQLNYVESNKRSALASGVWENITGPALQAVQGNNLAVRVGYFGVCAAQGDIPWLCRGSHDSLLALHQSTDPLGIITMAENIKNEVVFPGLL